MLGNELLQFSHLRNCTEQTSEHHTGTEKSSNNQATNFKIEVFPNTAASISYTSMVSIILVQLQKISGIIFSSSNVFDSLQAKQQQRQKSEAGLFHATFFKNH